VNDGRSGGIRPAARRLGSRFSGDNVASGAEDMSTDLSWSDVRCGLRTLIREVAEEISAYPRPITACDAQFNHLLELRRLLPAELARLEDAAVDPSSSVEAFIASSPCRAELAAAATVSDARGLTP
jgi:hypothetical protein